VSFRSLRRTWLAAIAAGLALPGPGAAAHERIVIPRIGLNVALARQIDKGPTVFYRDADTIAIAGHRTTHTRPFFSLPRLRRGDVIRVAGVTYAVKRKVVVRPWEVRVLNHSGLVLSACHPAGSSAYRIVVLASAVRRPSA
jgi:sortase (surface protein transpeptidase)